LSRRHTLAIRPYPKRGRRAGALTFLAVTCVLSSTVLAACTQSSQSGRAVGGRTGTYVIPAGIHKIKHVIVIMQENRSFDSYFGTFPGADGLPRRHGVFTVCVPAPPGHCQRPYHDRSDINGGGPHNLNNALADINHNKMNGFIRQAREAHTTCTIAFDPACRKKGRSDVMGFHTAAEIPNYWAYARHFVLQDHMFEAVKSWSLPAHLYMVSGWSAKCRSASPMSCKSDIGGPYRVAQFGRAIDEEEKTGKSSIDLAWTDITWLLAADHVSWAYYVQRGAQPDCADGDETCFPVPQSAQTPGIWNPLPLFSDVHQDHQLGNIQPLHEYLRAARTGTLPAVSWIVPNGLNSEHPPASVHRGQAYVTSIINAAMKSPDWKSTAIFLSWDDWGGFYDGVLPPKVDRNGYGLRVPGLVISPYAKKGFIDHQVLSTDAYLKFIEDDFLGGSRLNPLTDGRPDSRPDVREDLPVLGNMVSDFDFNQPPRPPFLLPTNPPTDSPHIPVIFRGKPECFGCSAPPSSPKKHPGGRPKQPGQHKHKHRKP